MSDFCMSPGGAFVVAINPGAGDIRASTRQKLSEKNARVFRRQLGLKGVVLEYVAGKQQGGRYVWRLSLDGRSIEVEMPGLPIEQVCWEPGDNPWEFPRLYVDGSSWLWRFALEVAGEALKGGEG